MATLLLCLAIASAPNLSLAQDQFPPAPDEVMVQIGLLPKEALTWPLDVVARQSVARIMELSGLAEPVDGVVRVANGPADEEVLRQALRYGPVIEQILCLVDGGILMSLGPEGLRLQQQLKRAWRMIPKLLAARSAGYFPDVPENHVWFERLADLKRVGLLRVRPTWRGPGPVSRLFCAVAIRDSCGALPGVAASMLEADPGEQQTFTATLRGLRALIGKFATELEALELDAKEMARAVDRAYRNGFPDVPATHWAALPIETLHSLGLWRGYPGNAGPRFEGSKVP